jgi:hypothetical protein
MRALDAEHEAVVEQRVHSRDVVELFVGDRESLSRFS